MMLCPDGTRLVLLVGPSTSQYFSNLCSNLHQDAQLLQDPSPGAPSAHPLRSHPAPFPACIPGHLWPGILEPWGGGRTSITSLSPLPVCFPPGLGQRGTKSRQL